MSTSQAQTFAAAAQVLAPPFSQFQAKIQTTAMQGAYRGYAAQVLYQHPRESNELEIVYVSVTAPHYDVVVRVYERSTTRSVTLNVSSGPRPRPVELVWDAAFHERFQVSGAPGAVLHHWLTPELQAILVRCRIRRVHIEAGRLIVAVARPSAEEAAIAMALDATVALVERLPHAIQSAGCGPYLAAGSLANHPDVVLLRTAERRSATRGGLILGAVLLFVLGVSGALIAACGMLFS